MLFPAFLSIYNMQNLSKKSFIDRKIPFIEGRNKKITIFAPELETTSLYIYMKRKAHLRPFSAHCTAWLSGGICTSKKETLRFDGFSEE